VKRNTLLFYISLLLLAVTVAYSNHFYNGFHFDDSHAIELAMRDRGIIASARGPVIRLAPHFYSTIEDVDTALDALADTIREL